VPELVVGVFGAFFDCPKEPDFVQNCLSIKSNFVLACLLVLDPPPRGAVFLVLWLHETMAILLFKLDQLFMLLVPQSLSLVFLALSTVQANEPIFVQESLSVWWHFVIEVSCPLVADPLP
jgi:hypothetical protein